MPIIRKHKRVDKPSVTRSKKQRGKNNTKRRGGKKKSKSKRKGGTNKTRRRRGGLQPSERTLLIMEVRDVMNDDLKNKLLGQETYDCIVREKLIEKIMNQGIPDGMSASGIFAMVYGEALDKCEQKISISDDGSGPDKVKGGGGGRDKSVQGEMSHWQPGSDRTLPPHVLRNITDHLQAQEEGNPRYGFIRFPSPVLKQTMDKVEEPPPLSYPPPPKLSEEQKNNMIIQQYTSIPDSGKILPMKFIVSENDPRTGSPFKVTYGDAGRIQFLHLKAVGDVPYWDESWLEPKRFHQSFKFPRPAPVLDDGWKRQYGSDVPAYNAPDRRGDILVAIDPFSKRDDKVIAEIGEVIRFPMSCDPHRIYTTHCFKINFNTPKELDFTSGQSDGERRRPYELTLPPQTVIRVIRGRKTDYPPMTPRETFREPPPAVPRK